MVVLVTGGAGYIGSHVSRALRKAGHEVIILDNLSTGHLEFTKGFEFIKANIDDVLVLERVMPRIDAVIHLAAKASVSESVAYPNTYFRNNVTASLTLLESCIDHSITKFIFASSCAVYGSLRDDYRFEEDAPRVPESPYGTSKLFIENALEAYSQAYGLRSVSLRYFNVAGADDSAEIGELHDPETHLIPLGLDAATGRGPAVNIFGLDYPTKDKTAVRDYVHVSDIAEAHVEALEYLNYGGISVALNLGSGRGFSVSEVVSEIENVVEMNVPQQLKPRRDGDPGEIVADPDRARRVLGWKANRNLNNMIRTAWKWSQVCATR